MLCVLPRPAEPWAVWGPPTGLQLLVTFSYLPAPVLNRLYVRYLIKTHQYPVRCAPYCSYFFQMGKLKRGKVKRLAWSPWGSQARAPNHILDVAPAPLNVNTLPRTVPPMPGPAAATSHFPWVSPCLSSQS